MIKLFSLAFSFFLASSVYAQENIKIYEERSSVEETEGPTTTIEFDTEIHDFGDIPQGSSNEFAFTFTNTGNAPLVITKARGSCGCTVPFTPKNPVLPGESSEIQAVFKPKSGQVGYVTKTITVNGNIPGNTTIVKIKANVIPVEDYEDNESFIVQNEQHEKDKEAVDALSPGCFVIFPNPTSNELQLDLKEYIGLSAVINIHDESGRDILQETITSISSVTTRFDVSGYTAGIYIIAIQVEDQNPMSQCFVVTK